MHDATFDKLAVLHHHPGYPDEYRLGHIVAPSLINLPDVDAPRSTESVPHRRTVEHWPAILALVLLTCGILLRRI